ncbi:cytochrome b561 and DOMON domain-containing protein [Carex littledalei]|uniref:Cytochrome b561 and DOMON domain-containing protein n=1 Tax=Carex littledalei TaxID=544730 RepID=A0A833R8B1_9POAL|nr:cytochrome b561 and DOMON domain-containing protein [Carex littledalei]
MASNTRLVTFLCLFLPVIFSSSTLAQNCNSDTFSNNKLYSSCTSLSGLSATLHWTYYSTNGTVDVAYRITQSTSTWVAWGINPTSTGMVGTNAFLAYHDSAGSLQIITSQLSSFSPTIANGSLTFTVYEMSVDYSNGAYTIYATLKLPNNSTTLNTVWQRGTSFSSGLPSGHPSTGTSSQTNNLNFLSGQSSSSGSGSSRLHRENIHGVLNAISWGILLPLGVMIARYTKVFKSMDPAWFYLHITCQCSGYILGVAGWGLGLKLGSESKGITQYGHRNIGIALFVFATLQVFALLLRPHKNNKYRLYWNIYHRTVGYAVIVLSIINIFKGFDILNPEKKWKNAYIGVIATLGGLAVILEATTWAIVLKRRSSEAKSPHGANGNNGYGARTHQFA